MIPHHVKDLQYETDFLLGRDYVESAKSIVSSTMELTMPLDLHIIGVVHPSPVKVVVRIESLSSSQRGLFLGVAKLLLTRAIPFFRIDKSGVERIRPNERA